MKDKHFEELKKSMREFIEDDTLYSGCCGAPMPDWPDCDLCPECKEHSEPFTEDEEDLRIRYAQCI